MTINTPPSLNFCSFSSKAYTEARWIRSCINVCPLQVPCAQHITLSICMSSKLAHTYFLLLMGPISHFIPCLERLVDWTTFTGIFFRFPVQVHSRNICKFCTSMVKVPRRYSQAQGVWSSPWSKFDQLLPILRLISGVLGRKSVAYLDYLYC